MAHFFTLFFMIFSLNLAVAQTTPLSRAERIDGLLFQLKNADETSAKPLERELDAAFSRSDSATTNLLMNRAMTALRAGQGDLSIYLLETVGELEPNFSESYLRLAYHHEMSEDYGQALLLLELALTKQPRDYRLFAQIGFIMMKLNNEKSAFKAFEGAMALNPHFSRVKSVYERLKLKQAGQNL